VPTLKQHKREETAAPVQQSFVEYCKSKFRTRSATQPLLHQFKFVPGGERSLKDCHIPDNKRLWFASDRPLDPEISLASFGWLLIGNGNVLVRGAGPVDGIPDLLSSTRAELFGYGGIVKFLHHFCKYHGIEDSTSKGEMWIDNKAAI